MKYQGKLHLSHKCKGPNPCWDIGQTLFQGDPAVWREMWHLNPKPWSSQLKSTALCLLPENFPTLTIYPTEAFSPMKKKNKIKIGSICPMAQPKKALSGCLLQLSLPVSPADNLVPSTAQCPQCLGEAARETQIQSLLATSLCHESK